MTPDVSGDWNGTLQTVTPEGYAVYDGRYGGPREIRQLVGSPPLIYTVTLSIVAQGDYEKTSVGPLVSIVSGHLDVYDSRTPAAGFVDDTGAVKLSFYASYADAWTFLGRLTQRGRVRTISGTTSDTMKSGSWWDDYGFGTLSVTKLGLNLSDRAYLHTYERFPF